MRTRLCLDRLVAKTADIAHGRTLFSYQRWAPRDKLHIYGASTGELKDAYREAAAPIAGVKIECKRLNTGIKTFVASEYAHNAAALVTW